jgi:hypothetical protein
VNDAQMVGDGLAGTRAREDQHGADGEAGAQGVTAVHDAAENSARR